jgi:hypothetical protein
MIYYDLRILPQKDRFSLDGIYWSRKGNIFNHLFVHNFTKTSKGEYSLEVNWLIDNFGKKSSGRYDYAFRRNFKKKYPEKVGTVIRDDADAILFRLAWN